MTGIPVQACPSGMPRSVWPALHGQNIQQCSFQEFVPQKISKVNFYLKKLQMGL